MKIPWKSFKWAGGAAALAIAAIAADALRFGGVFHSVPAPFTGHCRSIALGGSSEDIEVDESRGLVYLSLLDRDGSTGGAVVNGTVVLLDLNLAAPTPRSALVFEPENFRPHGLSLFKTPSQPAKLFALSHRTDGSHSVEVAEEGSSGGFYPKEAIRSDTFVQPTAIAAVGPRQFYLTNGIVTQHEWTRRTQALLRIGRTTLVYYDGTAARIVATDLKIASGVAPSPDATRLYVAEMLGRSLRIYQRNASTGDVRLEETIDLDVAPGNLNVDQDGVVWIAGFPKLLARSGHLRDARTRVPSEVLRFDPRIAKPRAGERDTRVRVIYTNDGNELSAGSAAARWREEFLIGAPRDRKVLICKPVA